MSDLHSWMGAIINADGSLELNSSLDIGTNDLLVHGGTWDSGGLDLASGDTYAIDGTDVLSATTLGSAVVNSSLTSVGTLTGLSCSGKVNLGTISELTISSGAVTITKSYHSVDTEGDASSDDLDTINGGAEGDILIIHPANNGRTVVAKDGTGNLFLAGDHTMDSDADTLTLQNRFGSQWFEIARSNNAT